MHRREFLLSATGIVGATTVGSIAYTNASVDRNVTASVSGDASAVIELAANSNVSGVSNTDGRLGVNVSSGLNEAGTFEYGDYSDPSTLDAFTITNSDTQSHDITVGLSLSSGIVKLKLDGPSGTRKEVTSSTSKTYTLAGGETIQASILIDTAGVSSGNSVSATMTFDAV